jgi:hypothetical protein
MKKQIAAVTIAAMIVTGCATSPGRINGVETPTQDNTGAEVAGAILAIILLGGLAYGIAQLGGEDSPDAVYRTTHRDGSQTKTEVYRK